MKKRFICGVLMIALIMIPCMFSSASYPQADPVLSAVDDASLLSAAAGLIRAQTEYYDIVGTAVSNVAKSVKKDGSVDVYFDLTLTMCLKASSVYELPFIKGMISASDGSDAAEKAISAAAEEYAEYIGRTSDFNYQLKASYLGDGSVSSVSSLNFSEYLPLEQFYPESAAQMEAHGAERYQVTLENLRDMPPLTIPYYRIDARDYADTWTSQASVTMVCPHGRTNLDYSYYNPAYSYYCHQDCANYISQAIAAGGIPSGGTIWYPGSAAWIGVENFFNFFYNTAEYWNASNYTNCNAGGIIINVNSNGVRYHVNMCVHNDTVTKKYSAHNKDHRQQVYTNTYWGSEATEFYLFKAATP